MCLCNSEMSDRCEAAIRRRTEHIREWLVELNSILYGLSEPPGPCQAWLLSALADALACRRRSDGAGAAFALACVRVGASRSQLDAGCDDGSDHASPVTPRGVLESLDFLLIMLDVVVRAARLAPRLPERFEIMRLPLLVEGRFGPQARAGAAEDAGIELPHRHMMMSRKEEKLTTSESSG